VPESERQAFDMRRFVRGVVDEDSFFEIHALWAREVVTGFARLDGQVIGVIANNPMFKGGVLFVDSADKAARFIQTCDAFGIPMLFLADVPGFMVGTAVERQGIIRHGAKMIAAMSDATVAKICVVVRKAYGAGLYAMAGPGFDPDATLALPTAKIAVMGAEAAVNAVYANKLEQITDETERAAETDRLRRDYEQDIDILRLASELVVDDVVEPEDLRDELVRRFAVARGRDRTPPRRRHGISPALLARGDDPPEPPACAPRPGCGLRRSIARPEGAAGPSTGRTMGRALARPALAVRPARAASPRRSARPRGQPSP
jgi:acetyl-CoA carboxylase carboxyltransferase component